MKSKRDMEFWIRLVMIAPVIFALVACGGGKNDQHMVQVAKEYSAQNKMREAALELKNALQINPENAEARYLLGRINLDLGDTAAAEKEFNRAISFGWSEEAAMIGLARAIVISNKYSRMSEEVKVKDIYSSPARANLHGLRAIAYAGIDDLGQAQEELEAGIKIDPDALYVLNAGVQLQIAAANLEEAGSRLKKALSVHPDDSELLLQSAVLAILNKDTDKAIDIYKKVIAQDSERLVTVYGRKARLELVRLEILNKNLDYAQTLLAPLFKQNKNEPLTNYMGGVLAYEQGDLKLAESRLLKVLKLAPDHAQTQLIYGAVSYAQKDFEQAAYYLGKYVSAVPENLGARKLLGRTYMLLGQHSEAHEALQPGIEDGIKDAELQALVGLSYLQGGNVLSGIEGLEKAIHAEPDSVPLKDELAKAYILAGQAENAIRLLNDMLADGGDRQQTEALLIYAHLRTGQFDKAVEAVLDMLDKDPGNPAVMTLAGSVFAASDNKAEARKYFNKALQAIPDFVPATMALARLEESEGNQGKAEQLYRRIAGAESNTIEPLIALARLAEIRGNTRDMLEWLEQAHKREPASKKPNMILAEYYLRENQPEMADIYITEVIKTAPRDNTILAMQGRVLMAQEKYNEALSPLKELVTRVPDSVYASILLGRTYLKLGQIYDARKHLELALEKQPYSIHALTIIAITELQAGNYGQALKYTKQIQKIDPQLYTGYELAGDALISLDNNAEAITAYTEAWERMQSAELAIKLSQATARSGSSEQVTRYLLEWLTSHPDDGRVLQFLGDAYQDLGQDREAISAYEKTLTIKPDNVVALNNLALLYLKTNDPRALALAERAHNINPGNSGVLDTYGWVLLQQGQVSKGRRTLEQAMEQLPGIPEVRYHYAVALIKSGETIKARDILKQLLASNEAFEGRDEAEALMDKN